MIQVSIVYIHHSDNRPFSLNNQCNDTFFRTIMITINALWSLAHFDNYLFHNGRSSMINLQVSIVHDHHSPCNAAVSNAEVVPILNGIQDLIFWWKYDDYHEDLVDKAD